MVKLVLARLVVVDGNQKDKWLDDIGRFVQNINNILSSLNNTLGKT